jgi:hypothetical protein
MPSISICILMSWADFVEVPVIMSPAHARDNPLIFSCTAPVLIVSEIEIKGLLASCRNNACIPFDKTLQSLAGKVNTGFSVDKGAIDLSIISPSIAIYEF